jgi:membrane protein required for colicin V production
MNVIDLFIIIIASYFITRGFFRGFISELAIVLGLVFGYILTITYLGLVSEILFIYLPKIPLLLINIIAFLLIFFVTNLIIRLGAGVITKTLNFVMLGWLNRLLGAFFGLIKSVIIMSFLVFLIELFPVVTPILEKIGAGDSILYKVLEIFGPEFFKQIQTLFQ